MTAVRGADDTPPKRCAVGTPDGDDCPDPPEIKLADGSGASAWSCVAHAEEVLISARGVFIAADEPDGLVAFLALRGRRLDGTRLPD